MESKKPLVIDSSVTVKWIYKQNEKYTAQADKNLKDVQNDRVYLLMPELAKYKVGNAPL